MHSTASVDRNELLSYDYRRAKILSVSENGHRLSRRFDFAKVRRLVFAGIPERVLFANTGNVRLDPGDLKAFIWYEDLAVWIRGCDHDTIMRDIVEVFDHYKGHLEIEIRLRTGKIITIRSVRKVN